MKKVILGLGQLILTLLAIGLVIGLVLFGVIGIPMPPGISALPGAFIDFLIDIFSD